MLDKIRQIAAGYEPALVASFVAALFTLAAGLGIAVGDLPAKVDAVLTFIAFAAPVIAGIHTRSKVTPISK